MDGPEQLLSNEEKLKFACYKAISDACDEIGETNTLLGKFRVDKEAKEMITEIVYTAMNRCSEDLEAFAGHAKRTTVNVDDIKLAFRRNPKILEMINRLEEEEAAEKPSKRQKVSETNEVEIE